MKPKPPELHCECGWHVIWFMWARDGVGGSCYDCGQRVNFYYETGEVRWI